MQRSHHRIYVDAGSRSTVPQQRSISTSVPQQLYTKERSTNTVPHRARLYERNTVTLITLTGLLRRGRERCVKYDKQHTTEPWGRAPDLSNAAYGMRLKNAMLMAPIPGLQGTCRPTTHTPLHHVHYFYFINSYFPHFIISVCLTDILNYINLKKL